MIQAEAVSIYLFVYLILPCPNFISTIKEKVTINYNKLHADQKQGKTLDIGKINIMIGQIEL